MELKVLFIDDGDIRKELIEFFDGSLIHNYTLKADGAATFDGGVEKIRSEHFDLIVLDLCQGEPTADANKEGLNVLGAIQSYTFVPVIFYSGIAYAVADLESEVVGVVNKSDGFKTLQSRIERAIASKIALLKSKIHEHIENELKNYFWTIVHEKRNIFKKSDFSLGYLLLRRLSHSLSKDKIKVILDDNTINSEKVHPMEFYIFPVNDGEYEAGEIVSNGENLYILLTPSCDFVLRPKGKGRKVGQVLMACISKLEYYPEYNDYQKTKNADNRNKLAALISNNRSDRYFFLPGTPFLNNSVIDFQNKIMVDYEALGSYQRIAKLDDPFSQSMVASFIRYYNRIGFPDIDSDFIINNI